MHGTFVPRDDRESRRAENKLNVTMIVAILCAIGFWIGVIWWGAQIYFAAQ